MSSLSLWALFAAVGIAFYAASRIFKLENRKLPPGPPHDPIIGNLRHIPQENQQAVFAEWRKIYGDVIHLSFPGNYIIVLNSEKAARELLDARSSNYSCRPRFVLMEEMMGWSSVLGLLQYGDRFRKHRRLMQQYFHPRVLQNYHPMIELEVAIFVDELDKTPKDFRAHLRRFSAGTVMKITYGHTVTSLDDFYVQNAEKAVSRTAEIACSGGMLVDFFPIMRYIPTWFPGAKFKRDAQSIKPNVRAQFEVPYDMVKEKMKCGNVVPSFTSNLMESFSKDGVISAQDEEDIRGLGGMIFSAAADTTIAVLETFILAMILYPDVLAKAQAEVDRIIGSDRLPSLSDRDTLPYLDAIITETLRWNPPLPLALPHRVMRDDSYDGYHIPKGSTVMPNIWGMNMDPEAFPDPREFRPERFLGDTDDIPNPRELVFGFGRRICPGKQFAEANIWLATATVVAALQIEKAKDDAGNFITPDAAFASAFVCHPVSFDCAIKPRSEKASILIHKTRANRGH